jgi:hypothetical protein
MQVTVQRNTGIQTERCLLLVLANTFSPILKVVAETGSVSWAQKFAEDVMN